MGGFGSGGSRSGAGRKRKPRHLRLIDGGADRRDGGGEPPDPPLASVPVEPPASLTTVGLGIWHEFAASAHAAGTLTATTRHSFAELCEITASCRELYQRLQPAMDATGQPRVLLRMSEKQEMACRREYRNLSRDLHARMKDFRLAPFGKELEPAGATPAQNPLDEFAR